MKNIQVLTRKVLDLLSEIETYSFHKANLKNSLKRLFQEYQQGKYSYFEYEKTQKKLLKGKTEDEWLNYYDSYVFSLLKRVETYNAQIFYETYKDEGYVKLDIVVKPLKQVPKPVPKHVARPVVKPAQRHGSKHQMEGVKPAIVRHVIQVKTKKVEEPIKPVEVVIPDVKLVEIKPSFMDRVSIFFRGVFARKEINKQIEELKMPARAGPVHKPVSEPASKHAPKPVSKPIRHEAEQEKIMPVVKKKSWFGSLFGAEKSSVPIGEPDNKKSENGVNYSDKFEPSATVAMGHFFGIDYIKNLLSRSRKVSFEDKRSKIPISTIQLETLRRKAKPEIQAQIEKITATSLTKEASRIRSIMEQRKTLKIYQPSFFGSLANLIIRRISLFLLDTFPEFFKDLYHALRLANLKVLSNTYVNMMVFGILISSIFGLFIFGIFFTASALPLMQVILRTLMMSMLTGLTVFAGFYAYPYSKMKQRRRSINTNLPFAINHMAAVASSGVAPVRMFKLISESKEYGEISVEIEKIVNYVEIFGYDVLTALKSVAATTPSYQFKDFFEGMISNTQTGGDLRQYFSQKSDEAMMNYKLERQKYTETVSTYSDIYTGILIAAPLFFVATLSLVSLLGGQVGGIDVNVIIVIGTYVVIPFMNVSFLTFLEMTQPEI